MSCAVPPQLASSPRSEVRGILFRVLLLNLAVAAAKVWYGRRTGSASLTADGFHSLLDGASSAVGLLGIRLASAPPDAGHPYGHRKYEHVATGTIGALLLGACYEVLAAGYRRLQAGEPPVVDAGSFAVVLGTLAINLGVSRYEARRGRELRSAILQADALHTRSDVFASLSVIAALIAARAGLGSLDAVAAGLIVLLILRIGLRILRQSLDVLSDAMRIDPAVVEEVVRDVAGVRGCHRIRTRGASDDIHVDLHLLVEPSMSTDQAHELVHEIERRIRGRFEGITDVIVHVEPEQIGEQEG